MRVRELASNLASPAGVAVLIGLGLAVYITTAAGSFVLVDSLVTGSMWALVAAGLALVFGVMNIPNFAQGEFFMVGTLAAYLTFTAMGGSSGGGSFVWAIPFVAILAAVAAGGVIGAATDRLLFETLRRRTREEWVMNTFVITVGLSTIMVNAHQLIWGTDFKGIYEYWRVAPVQFLGVSIGFDRLMAMVIALVAITVLGSLLKFHTVGRAIRAVAQDETGAKMVAIDIGRVHTLTFAISGAYAAMAGGTLLFMFPSSPYVGLQPLYISWTVVILVGLGNVGAAIIGGFLVAFLQSSTSFFFGSEWQDVIPFLLITVILMIRPSGLFGSRVRGVWEQ